MENNDNYEFKENENLIFSSLAHKMKYVGFFGILIGSLNLVLSSINIINFFYGLFYIFIGFWTIRAAKFFKLVVDTQGNDIQHLMDALKEQRKLFTFHFGAYIILAFFVCFHLVSLYYMGINMLEIMNNFIKSTIYTIIQ